MPKQQIVRIAQIGLVVVALVVVGLVLFIKHTDKKSAGKTASAQAVGSDGWSLALSGRPSSLGATNQKAAVVKPGAKPGIYLWSGFDGWHLWVVNGTGIPQVSGILISNDVVAKADIAVAGGGQVTKSGNTVTFAFSTTKPISGMDFSPGFFAKNLAFSLRGPGGPIELKLVHLGIKVAPTTTMFFAKVPTK